MKCNPKPNADRHGALGFHGCGERAMGKASSLRSSPRACIILFQIYGR
jgi:hypothetical protein